MELTPDEVMVLQRLRKRSQSDKEVVLTVLAMFTETECDDLKLQLKHREQEIAIIDKILGV